MLACNHTKPFFNRVHEDTPFRLVHFGPQQGMMNVINRFLPSIDQVGVDYFAESYIYDKSRTLHADVTDLKFPDNFANGIIILHVLEHIRALETAAKEMLRVLAPGGWIVMEVPCNQKKETKDCRKFNESVDLISCAGQRDHVWSFNCRDFQDDMKEYGMKCEAGYELDNQKDCLDPSLRESILPKPGSAPVLFCVRND
jgi:SAM-dependent methyltransferase